MANDVAAAMVAAMLWWLGFGLAILGIRRFFLGYRAAPVGVEALSAPAYETARAAALVIYPRGGAIAASGDSARVALHADRFVAAQGQGNRFLMRLLFVAVEHGTLLFPTHGPGGWRRFTSLGPDQQLAYLEGWRQSELAPRRLVFMSLRAILTMGYFADPEVLRGLGLSPRELPHVEHATDDLWPAVGAHPRTIGSRRNAARGRAAEGAP